MLVVTPYVGSNPSGYTLLPGEVCYEFDATGTFSFPVTVTLPIPATYTGALSDLKVLHMKNDGTTESVAYTVVDGGHAVQFAATSFSGFGTGSGQPVPVFRTPASSPWSLVLVGLLSIAVFRASKRFRAKGTIA